VIFLTHLRKFTSGHNTYKSHPSFTDLLQKSLFFYENHSSLTEVTFNYESQFKLRKSTTDGAIFMLFIVVYRSSLSKFILVYESSLSSSCGLRKSTSGIKSLAKVDFLFVVFVSDMDTHRSILQSTQ